MESVVTAENDSDSRSEDGLPTGNSDATDIDKEMAKRRSFTIKQKLAMVKVVKRRAIEGESIRSVCRELNIQPKMYRYWSKRTAKMMNCRPDAHTTNTGDISVLFPIQEQILRYIFEMREKGMGVSMQMVAFKACQVMPELESKSSRALYQVISRWIKHHSITHRMGTHESQKDPSETSSEAKDYIEFVRPFFLESTHSQDFVINMDQTPIPFTFNAKRTLELVGKRTIYIRKSVSDTKRVTCAITVTASGKILPAMMIFKGIPGKHIETRELPLFDARMFYTCQSNAWMDERVMILWVEKVLKPYVLTAPYGVIPLLFLDSYRCHMMRSVVELIQGLGVQVEHIPGGCTYLCQPVDIGVNKPFKVRIRKLWEQWMVAEGLATNTTSPPTRKHIADWAVQAINEIPEQLVRNAWRHGEYAYYLPTVPGPPTWDAAPPPLDGSDGDNNDMDGDENIAEQHE